jgi:hypothetical protein
MTGTTRRLLGALAIAISGLCAVRLQAQTTVADPNDPLYAVIDAWATKGLLKNLPRLRPYTMAMTVGLLREVAASGREADADEAQRYLDILEDSAVHVRADTRATAVLSSSETSYVAMAAPGFSINSLIGGRLGISTRMDVWLTTGNADTLAPYGTRFDRDPLFGSGSGLPHGTEVTQDLVSDLSYGTEDLGIQAGLIRGSWGPVYDNGVVIGPQSPQSGQLLFSWRTPAITTDFGFLMLQQGWPGSVGLNSQKYLVIHGVNWSPLGWLELGIFEAMVWVDRIEPLYFIPLSEFFISQAMAGYSDNSFMGVSASAYLPNSMKLDLVGFADDLDFGGVLSGRFDTKWKMAVQACLSWAPESRVLQRLSLDYTAVGPYTYTHWAEAGSGSSGLPYYGAMAYTNAGKNLGPALDPNSDRITLQAKSWNIGGARISGVLRLIRHGNASEGVNGYNSSTSASGDASGDLADCGLIKFADPLDPDKTLYAWIFQGDYDTGTSPKYIRFLTQAVLQVSAQAGFDIGFTKYLEGIGTLNAGFGYLFEYMANTGCVAGATSLKHYFSLSAGLAL